MSLDREKRTIEAMVRIYCRAHHTMRSGLCDGCRDLQEYALLRVEKCPFGPDKPVCARCPIHCYPPQQLEQIRKVMRFSGPRMVWRHPRLALAHLLQKRRPVPSRPDPAEDQPGRAREQSGIEQKCSECENL